MLLAHYFRYIDVVELVVLVVALIVSKTVAVVFSISEEVAVAIIKSSNYNVVFFDL